MKKLFKIWLFLIGSMTGLLFIAAIFLSFVKDPSPSQIKVTTTILATASKGAEAFFSPWHQVVPLLSKPLPIAPKDYESDNSTLNKSMTDQ